MRFSAFFILVFLVLVSGFAPLASSAACKSGVAGYCADMLLAQIQPNTQGLEFLNLGATPNINALLSGIYVFGLGVVALSAFVMMVFGGVQYLVSGDNESRLRAAKDAMKNALFGLALAFVSWLILNTINPALVNTPFPPIPPIPAILGGPTFGGLGLTGLGGTSVGSTQVVTGVGLATVSQKSNVIDMCTPAGQTQKNAFCQQCTSSGGINCIRSTDFPSSNCNQTHLCLSTGGAPPAGGTPTASWRCPSGGPVFGTKVQCDQSCPPLVQGGCTQI